MMNSSLDTAFDADRAVAWRSALIEHAARSRRRRRALASTGLVLAGVVGGFGLSTAALAAEALPSWMYPAQPAGQIAPSYPPAGVLPGAPVIAMLGTATALEVSSPTDVPLDDQPPGATHVRVTLTARAPGSMSWGTDAAGNDPSVVWSQSDIATPGAKTWNDFPIDGTGATLSLHPDDGADVLVVIQYVSQTPTRLGVNAEGKTFGVDGGPSGAPDLIAVVGQDDNGDEVEGYVWRADLHASAPEAPAPPTNPEEAVHIQEERARDHPGGWDVPVYASDGTTRLGTFHIG